MVTGTPARSASSRCQEEFVNRRIERALDEEAEPEAG
jgi:hypothetical protein